MTLPRRRNGSQTVPPPPGEAFEWGQWVGRITTICETEIPALREDIAGVAASVKSLELAAARREGQGAFLRGAASFVGRYGGRCLGVLASAAALVWGLLIGTGVVR